MTFQAVQLENHGISIDVAALWRLYTAKDKAYMASTQNSSHLLIDASNVILPADAPIIRAIETIDRTDARIALIVDGSGKLIGSATDGDIRRALLRGEKLEAPVKIAMHTSPYAMPLDTPRQSILDMMQSVGIKQVPLLSPDGTIAGIVTYDILIGQCHAPRPNPVVIMAGGKGKRLLPITSDIPKPMVEVGNKPILEWIVQRFIYQGFHEFYFAVNYLGHIIENYFGDGSRLGCRISYLKEKEFMGTAGALSLLDQKFSHPLVVVNGDILASVDFGNMVDFHYGSKSMATVCARPHRMEVPYGVIEVKDGMLKAIVEKPIYEDLISAGMYVLNPEALRLIPRNAVTDMPTVLTSLLKDKHRVSVFPLREEWMDIGRHDDLEQAKRQFASAT